MPSSSSASSKAAPSGPSVPTTGSSDGYTQIVVDVRGTGFSQGTWNVFQQREQQDTPRSDRLGGAGNAGPTATSV